MPLYDPENDRLNLQKKGFVVDADKLTLLIGGMPQGRINHCPPSGLEPLAKNLALNPNFVYSVASGVPIAPKNHAYNGQFRSGQLVLAVEIVRFEQQPKLHCDEPSFNLNRYVFGVSASSDKAFGIDVTTWRTSSETGQVGDHWGELYSYLLRHFPTTHE
jgi:hypothetical protein